VLDTAKILFIIQLSFKFGWITSTRTLLVEALIAKLKLQRIVTETN